MFTHFFIDRPILSSVISILIVLAGAVSMVASPIEQYPDMAPPQVTITAIYPGATAEVIANNVAAPIETQLNGIDNLLYFYSTSSSSGNAQIVVVFKPGTNIDTAQVPRLAVCRLPIDPADHTAVSRCKNLLGFK